MIEFEHVTKVFHGKAAVSDVSLNFARGAFSVLVGTSGSGKSTMLKMINRMVDFDSGIIRFAGEPVTRHPVTALRRRMGYAIQSIGLFPHWTVAENIATVPRLLKWPDKKIHSRVIELLELLNLEPAVFYQRYPHQLSGGQQQRVGVARALAADPEVLLMDEPFGALDPVTRSSLQQEILRVQRAEGRTIILVTHDIDEALALADHLVLMDNGKVVQQGAPDTLLRQPANDFVRGFFGDSDRGIRLLGLYCVKNLVRLGEAPSGGVPVSVALSLREALSAFIQQARHVLPVVNGTGEVVGNLHLQDVINQGVTP